MSDPVKYFEKKLQTLSLSELEEYKKRLDNNIQEKILKSAPNEQIAPLILYRGILEHEIKKKEKHDRIHQ